MPLVAGINAIHQGPEPDRPHILGHAIPRQPDDPLFVVANDDVASDRRFIVYPNKVEILGDLDVQGSILGYAEDPHGNEAHTEDFLSEAVIDGLATEAALNAHINSQQVHGATGQVVGTLNEQTLFGKTLTAPVINNEITGDARATQQEAEAGTSVTKIMTPARVSEALDARAPSIGLGWELIEDQTFSSGSTLLSFNGISSDYRELRLEFVTRITPVDARPLLRLNSQGGSDYQWRSVTRRSDQAGSTEDGELDASGIHVMPGTVPAGQSSGIIRIAKATPADRATVHIEATTAIAASHIDYHDVVGFWDDGTNSISRVTIQANSVSGSEFAEGSRFILYGRRNEFS